ncbi:unnamed protein product [Sphagnum tenellum]
MMERGERQRQAVFGTEYKSVVPASSSSGEASVVPSLETASEAAAAAASQDPYPQRIYGALLTPEAPPSQELSTVGILQGGENQHEAAGLPRLEGPSKDEIQELFTNYIDKHGMPWTRLSARKWVIEETKECNVFIGSLETFIEERELMNEVKPYDPAWGHIDKNTQTRSLGPWEVDVKNEFPALFTPQKETKLKLPNSDSMEKCPDCLGQKEVPCPICSKSSKVTAYKYRGTMECSRCQGRGLLAHRDGSDSKCEQCEGKGRLPCEGCKSQGLIKCSKCQGLGALLHSKLLIVRWRTLVKRKISASSDVALVVPESIFHGAKGIPLFSSEAYQCQPMSFLNAHELTQLSSDVISEREQVPVAARLICERHQIHSMPVTCVTIRQGKVYCKFFIVGLDKQVYLTDVPSRWDKMGVTVGILSLMTALVLLWKFTRSPKHSRQFIVSR